MPTARLVMVFERQSNRAWLHPLGFVALLDTEEDPVVFKYRECDCVTLTTAPCTREGLAVEAVVNAALSNPQTMFLGPALDAAGYGGKGMRPEDYSGAAYMTASEIKARG